MVGLALDSSPSTPAFRSTAETVNAAAGAAFRLCRGDTAALDRETYRQRAEGAATNVGIEMLYAALPDASERFDEGSVADTDGDGAYEVVDEWGHPLVFVFRAWVQAPGDFAAPCVTVSGDAVTARLHPERLPDGWDFQLYSMGADAIPNTEDDVFPPLHLSLGDR